MSGSLRRVFRERRVIILPLAVALLVNVAIVALVVYPVVGRVARAEQQEQAALQELAAAQREFGAATRTQRDKARAEQDLQKFYTDILPADLAGARRATYLHLAQLAQDAGLQYQRRLEESREPKAGDQDPASTLARFDITMVLEGDYEGVRQFLRDVEASDGLHRDRQHRPGRRGRAPSSNLVLTVETVDLLPGGDTWKLAGVNSCCSGRILVVLAGVLYWQSTRSEATPEEFAAAMRQSAPVRPARRRRRAGAAAARRPRRRRFRPSALASLDGRSRSRPTPGAIRSGSARRRPRPRGAGRRGAAAGRGAGAAGDAGGAAGAAGAAADSAASSSASPGRAQGRLYAVLRDERGIYYGADGDVVEGRYRILRVSAEHRRSVVRRWAGAGEHPAVRGTAVGR